MRIALTIALLGLIALAEPTTASAQTDDSEFKGRTIDSWIKDIDSTDASIRENGILAIREFGPALARRALPKLIYRIKNDKDLSPKVQAIIAVGDIGITDAIYADQITEALMFTLKQPQAIVQFQSAQSLGKIAENSPKMIPQLKKSIPQLADNLNNQQISWKNQQAYAFALGRIAGDKEKGPDRMAILALAAALRDDTRQVRLEAIQSLLMLGTPGDPKDALTLERILEQRLEKGGEYNKVLQVWIRLLLIRIDGGKYLNAPTIKKIGDVLPEGDYETRMAGTIALGLLETNARPEVPRLLAQLDGDHPELILTTCNTLGRIGDPAANEALEKLNTHKEAIIRFAARDAIAKIKGEKPKDNEKEKKEAALKKE